MCLDFIAIIKIKMNNFDKELLGNKSLKELSNEELVEIYGGNETVTPATKAFTTLFCVSVASVSFVGSYLASAAFKC